MANFDRFLAGVVEEPVLDGFGINVAIGPVGACTCDSVNKSGRAGRAGRAGALVYCACEVWPKPPKLTGAGVLVDACVLAPRYPNRLFEGAGVAVFANEFPKENAGVTADSPCVLAAIPLRPFDWDPNVNPCVLVPNILEPPAVTVFEVKGLAAACEFASGCETDPKPPNNGLGGSELELPGGTPDMLANRGFGVSELEACMELEMAPNRAFGVDALSCAAVVGCVLAPN